MATDMARSLLEGVNAILNALQGNHSNKTDCSCAAYACGRLSPNDCSINWKEKTSSVFSGMNGFAGSRTTASNTINGRDRWNTESSAVSGPNGLLRLAQECFNNVPVLVKGSDAKDMPLYQVLRIGAALRACMTHSHDEKPFVLYSLDLSGIQKFIYTISTKGALKALRARSVYLSLLLENTTDDILSAAGLSRANLIYCGGGRAHILLPNDRNIIEKADAAVAGVNEFLMNKFDTALYLAHGSVEFGPDNLIPGKNETSVLAALFIATSQKISSEKLRRYSFSQIVAMNGREHDSERECAVCGISRSLKKWDENRFICDTCQSLEKFSTALRSDIYGFTVTKEPSDYSIAVPGGFITPVTESNRSAIRQYRINGNGSDDSDSIPYYMSCCGLADSHGRQSTFDDYVDASCGIKRLGVFRCDVDNLGALFANGFKRNGPEPWRDYNLSQYAALSASLTGFFQRDIDGILKGAEPISDNSGSSMVSVVYAGGDDVFLIGAWDQTLAAGLALRKAFKKYTGGAVTLSGGFGLYRSGIPVNYMAEDTAKLENAAKEMPGKDALALFTIAFSGGREIKYISKWDDFSANVLNEKLALFNRLFAEGQDKGSAFLYKLNELFVAADAGNQSALPRIAYHLARNMGAKKEDEDKEQAELKQSFVKNCYAWASDEKENRAFRTAVLLYVYLNRNASINGKGEE